jgi:hypothetical protein
LDNSSLPDSAPGAFGQATPAPADRDQTKGTRSRASADNDADITYGRVKEITAGQKVVIAIDNAPDKTFELADKDVKVNLAKGLKVGDPVKVSEQETMGKTRSVTISKHTGGSTPAKRP